MFAMREEVQISYVFQVRLREYRSRFKANMLVPLWRPAARCAHSLETPVATQELTVPGDHPANNVYVKY